VCMCEFECVCWIVFPPKSSTSVKRTWFFYPESLFFGERKTRKSDSGFSALLHFLILSQIYTSAEFRSSRRINEFSAKARM
jgi:hypothetical protein